MNFHRGVPIQQGAGLGSMFSGLFRALVPAAKTAVKTIAKNDGIRSAGKYLKKEATRAAVDTALEALQGKPVGAAAKKRLKTATKNILQASKRNLGESRTQKRKGTTKRKHVRFQTNRNFKRRKRVEQDEPLFDDDEYDDDY